MKKFKILLLITFLIGCSKKKNSINDVEILKKLYENTLNNEYLIDSIITYEGPSNFKNISIDFDIHQVIYRTKNNKMGSKFYTLTQNEIFRLGKGLNCLIIIKEIRWKKTGEIVTNLKSWLVNDDREELSEKPNNKKSSNDHTEEKNNLPESLKRVTCN